MAEAWRIRAWGNEAVEAAFLARAMVAVSLDEVDVTDNPSDDMLRARIEAAHPDRPAKGVQTFVRYWRNFLHDMEVGDVVALPLTGRRLAIGVVTGPAVRDASAEPWARNHRPVRWEVVGLARTDLPDDLLRTVNSQGTICRFRAPNAAERLLAAAR
jgi:predicted Mrr-cat superfamily restriction endonuclease